MDFSTVPRSLQSLHRRKPEVSSEILEIATTLSNIHDSNTSSSFEPKKEYEDGIIHLIESGTTEEEGTRRRRWEPLAVGLNLAVDYLDRISNCLSNSPVSTKKSEEQQNPMEESVGGVYVDGPRVPILTGEHSPIPSSTTTTTQSSSTSSSNSVLLSLSPTHLQHLIPFSSQILSKCRSELEHDEPRVRTLVARCIGSHARLSVNHHRTNNHHDDDVSSILESQRRHTYSVVLKSLVDHLSSGREQAEGDALDDTTGWRSLETDLHALASYVDGCGMVFVQEEQDHMDGKDDVMLLNSLKHCCIVHINRHVRAAGLSVLERIVSSCSLENTDLLTDVNSPLRLTVVSVLKVTLADNWSQVRMAASVLNRSFFVAVLKGDDHDDEGMALLYKDLLPRMCLNRFYLAQGVKLYSLDTWKLVFGNGTGTGEGGGGLDVVAANASFVCKYYVEMCDADNHAVREAACQAVAELAQKLGTNTDYAEYLEPFVPLLLQALIMCFHDESWPVRDEACLACGTFCRAYPDQCRPELPTLFSRWTEQLSDQIWSVREDAAVALGDAILAYGPEMLTKVLELVRKRLPSAKHQPAMTKEESKRRQNDIDAHTNSQLYSCGSLAPKLGKKGGAGRIGCTSCVVDRPKAPWEETDGCIYLLREICLRCCSVSAAVPEGLVVDDATLLPLMTELADVCRVKHFPQGDDLRTTLWRQLPAMAAALGKQRFKRNYLQLFMDLMASNFDDSKSSASQLSIHAAGQCAEDLSALVGRGIFRGRLEDDWQRQAFDRVMEERSRMNAGPVGGPFGMGMDTGAGFSPYGPPGTVDTRGAGGVPFPQTPASVPSSVATSPPQSFNVPGSGFSDTL